jgi:hypothetical protein
MYDVTVPGLHSVLLLTAMMSVIDGANIHHYDHFSVQIIVIIVCSALGIKNSPFLNQAANYIL